ncbi:MAG TPA: PKD domain-containing protein [Solirubrobacteraceae bacterium]|jgi:hypothetical protein
MLRPRTISLLALLALLLLAPVAHAAEWVAPVNFAVPAADLFEGAPDEEQIGYQNGGTATEAFVQLTSLAPLSAVLHIGTMPPGGSYSDQLVLPSSAEAIPARVKIAVAPDGAAVAGWIELTGPNDETSPCRFRAAYRPAGSGTWEAPFTIATEAKRASTVNPAVSVAISAKGSAAVGAQSNANEAGTGQGEATSRIDVAVRSASSVWSTERISPAAIAAEELELGIDLIGNLTVAYKSRYDEGPTNSQADDRYTVIARVRSAANGVWGPRVSITGSSGSASSLQLGENEESGDAVLAYQYDDAGESTPWATTRQSSGGAWSEPSQLVLGGSTSAPEGAGVAPNGTAYVLYRFDGNSSGEDCEGAVRAPVDHTFTPERCISPVDEEGSPGSIAFLGDEALLAWRGNPPGSGETEHANVEAARWTNGASTPEAARNLDQADAAYESPTLVADRQGSVVAFYRDNTSRTLRAAAYDGGPPILLGASVPASATAGQPVTFSASLVDLWAGLGTATWSFSDGTSSAGATVTHTFAAAGTYAVALTAPDALGNTTTGTYAIVVAPAPPKPPPPATGDRKPPSVTLDTPSCPKKLSKKACKRRRASTAAWRTLHGGVSDPAPSSGIASVQVVVYRTRGRHIVGLSHGRFAATTKAKARAAFVTAKLSGDSWSLKLPKLARGSYTILVRANDRAGNRSALVSRTVRLS